MEEREEEIKTIVSLSSCIEIDDLKKLDQIVNGMTKIDCDDVYIDVIEHKVFVAGIYEKCNFLKDNSLDEIHNIVSDMLDQKDADLNMG